MLEKFNYFRDPLRVDALLGEKRASWFADMRAELNESTALETIHALRRERLERLLMHASSNVPFYASHYAQNALTHVSSHATNLLERVPMVTKQDLRTAFPHGCFATNIGYTRRRLGITSGSTGEPFRYAHDRAYDGEKRALAGRVWRWAHADVFAPKIYCSTESARTLWPHMIFLHPHFIQSHIDQYARAIKNSGAQLLFGYPLTTFELLWTLSQHGATDLSFRAAVLTGHCVSPGIRTFFLEHFECQVFEYYAAMELGIIAIECEAHHGLHLQEEHTIVEIVDASGNPCPPGTIGQILVTSLSNDVMPFIRYAVGDIGFFLSGACPCGRTSRRILVEGRSNEHLFIAPNQESIYPGILRDVLDDYFDHFQRYQLIQIDLRHFVLKIVPTNSCSASVIEEVVQKIKAIIRSECQVSASLVDAIPALPSGKFQYFVSSLWPKKFPPGTLAVQTLEERQTSQDLMPPVTRTNDSVDVRDSRSLW